MQRSMEYFYIDFICRGTIQNKEVLYIKTVIKSALKLMGTTINQYVQLQDHKPSRYLMIRSTGLLTFFATAQTLIIKAEEIWKQKRQKLDMGESKCKGEV